VQLFEAPDTADLESLPDQAVFVLRAVVQLELAAFEDIVDATRLPTRQVEDALRYGSFRGYLERIDGRYRVHWRWFRSVSRFLERRHLLAKGI
jgi:DNA-binding IclR family transcriptional regulator